MTDIEEEISKINAAMNGIKSEITEMQKIGADTTSLSNTFSLLEHDLDDFIKAARDEDKKLLF